VDLFFVLSGFLITGILVDSRGAPRYFRDFYIRRSLRIFPLYYAFLVVVFIIVPLVWRTPSAEYRFVAAQQAWYWTYTVNIAQVLYGLTRAQTWETSHLWSLAVEEQFYLIWPAVVWFCSPRALRRVCLASIGIGVAIRIAIVATTENYWGAYVLMPARIDALALGGLIAVMARSEEGSRLLRRLARPLGIVAAVILLIHLAVTLELRPMQPFVTSIGLLCTAIVSGAVLIETLSNPQGLLGRFANGGILRRIGRYSYGAYVLHMPLRGLMAPLRQKLFDSALAARFQTLVNLAWVLALIVASVALAALSFHAFESRFLALRDRFRPAMLPPTPAENAVTAP
jgi:peptidoglycan/LPS O-acetylase OafA/YrhL